MDTEKTKGNQISEITEALADNLQLLPLIMNNIPQAVFWKDQDLVYLGCNQAFAEDAGLDSPDQIIGKTDYDMPWTNQAELYREDDAQVMESGEAKINYEEPQTSPDGETTWLRTSKIPVKDDDGKVIAVLGMYEDITDEKQVEQSIRDNEGRLRAIYEGSNDAVMLLTPAGFFDCNPRTLELFGFESVEEFTKVHPADISPPLQPDGSESFPAAQKQIQIAYEQGFNRFEWVHRHINGEDFPAEVLLSAFEMGGETVLQATVRDITRRKQAELALEQSERLLFNFINNFPDGVWAKDVEGRFLLANKYVSEKIAGQEVIGKTVYETMPKENADFVWASEKHLLENGEPISVEEDVPHADGKIYKKITTKFPLYDSEGNINGVGGVLIDITDRKKVEQALKEEQERLQNILENISIPIIISRLKDSTVLYANRALAQVGQIDLDALIGGRTVDYFVNPTDRDKVVEALSQQGHVEAFETQLQRGNGEIYWALLSAHIINYQGETSVFTSYTDITEYKSLQRQLQEAYERRGYQVQVSTEISQEIAQATELGELFHQVVTLTKERLGYYHTQLLRYEPAQDEVVLITGYGETGQKMLAQGHHMPLGSGLIGTAAESGETVMRPDLAQEPDWQPNPLLPETKGEISVPIKLGDEILGVLDIQSNRAGALTTDDQLLLEGLCGQIAIAMEQTRLRREMEDRLTEINRLYRAMSREGWQTFASTTTLPEGFQYDQSGVRAIDSSDGQESLVSASLTVPGGAVIGTLAIVDDTENPLSPEDQAFLEQVSEQVALALESARLFEQTQSSLAETQSLYRFNEAISGQMELETVYQVVARMVCEEMGFSGSWIALYNSEDEALHGVSGINLPEDRIKAIMPINQKSPATLAAYMRRPVIVNDPQNDDRMADIPVDVRVMLGKALAIPVLIGKDLAGAISVTRSETGADIGDREERILQVVANQLAITMERARLFEQTQEALARTDELYNISQAMNEAGSEAEILEALAQPAVHNGAISAILMYLDLDEAGTPEWTEIVADWRAEGQAPIPVGTRFYLPDMPLSKLWMADPENPLQISDVRTDARIDDVARGLMEQSGSLALAIIPLTRGGEQIGMIVFNWDQTHEFSSRENETYRAIIDLASPAVQSRRLFERTQSALAAVQESEAQLGEALKIARLGNFEYDVENDIFTFNDHFYAIFHVTAEEVGGYQISSEQYAQKFVHPDDLPLVGEEIGKALNSTERYYTTQIEHRILYGDGGEGYISVNVHVERDEDGNITRYYGANQDITERRLAEEAVRQAQERAQTILETVTLPMVITRLSDNILTFANQPAAEIVGLTLEEFVNQPAPDFYHNPEERSSFIDELREQGFVNSMQVQLVRGDGSTFYSLLSARMFTYEGEPSILTTITDITERIEAQEATAKRAAELATVADVGTLISTVLEEQPLLETVVHQTQERFELYHCHIFLVDAQNQTLQVKACGWEENSPHQGTVEQALIHTDQEQSLVAQAARDQKAVIVNDVRSDPNWLSNELLPETRSEMAVPLIAGNQVLGVLDVQSNEVDRFTEEDVSIMTTLSSQVAVALQNARTYAQTQQQAEYEAMINLISQRIQSTTSVENALQVAIRELGRALGAKRTNIQLGLPSQKKSG